MTTTNECSNPGCKPQPGFGVILHSLLPCCWALHHRHYREGVGIETQESIIANDKFNAALDSLAIDKINEIYTLAVTMNAEETRVAFHASVKLGTSIGSVG